MGIDLDHRKKSKGRTECKSPNTYIRLLVQLYTFLKRRAESKFNTTVFKRLITTRSVRQPLSLADIDAVVTKEGLSDRIVCLVGRVIDSSRLDGHNFPALKICALQFSAGARARILKSGGECITFDQLATISPKGEGCALLKGDASRRPQAKFFGKAPGEKNSKTPAKTSGKGGRKSENARPGRRFV